MKRILFILTLSIITCFAVSAQTGSRGIRIADTLTLKDKAERNPVILRSELDSLIKLYAPVQLPVQENKPESEKKDPFVQYILSVVLAILVISGILVFVAFRQRKVLFRLTEAIKQGQSAVAAETKNGKIKAGRKNVQAKKPEEQLEDLFAEINRLERENQNLSGVISGYNGIKHEYDTLKEGILRAFKVKNYPGYEKSGEEATSIRTVLDTEKAVAEHAYITFLKPVLALADANKNNPSKMSSDDKEKMLELLVSLSLFYIEYLYLRVGELAVGGTMVERIKNFSKGAATNKEVLKTLNKDAGSRALVMRIALDKAAISQLSYPVFDETNINQ